MATKTAADARKALDRIRPLLAQMERGAGFCEDRGYGWSVESEDREGRPVIAQLVASHPQLAEVLPQLAKCLADNRPFADISWQGPLHTADQALAAMTAKASFNRKPGDRSRYGRT